MDLSASLGSFTLSPGILWDGCIWSSVIAYMSSSSSISGHPSSLPSACQRLEEVVQRLEEEKGKKRRKSITEDEEDDESSSLAGFLDSPEGEYFQYS